MKVIKIINTLDFGGIEKVFEIVATYYPGNKDELIFIALGSGGRTSDAIKALGFEVILLGQNTKIPNFKIVILLYKLLKKHKPDVVHACGAEGNFHGLIAGWFARVPVRIAEEIGMPSHSKVAKLVFRMVYSTATYVIAVADSVKQYLIETKEVRHERCKIVYNPVDIDRFIAVKRKSRHEKFILLAVCRLHAIKNLEALIECIAILKNDNKELQLWLVGEGGLRGTLEALVAKLGLMDDVIFQGYSSNPAEYLAQANAFILPSFSEGHPVSMVEAMVAGVPAIVTKIGGGSEIIIQGESGWLIDPYDKKNIADTIKLVMDLSPENLQSVVVNARTYALNNFSPAYYFKELSNLYHLK